MAVNRALFAGDDPTPDSVKRRMALAELLQQQGSEFAHVDSPLEAIGSILNSGAGYLAGQKAQKDQNAGMATRNQAYASLLLGGAGPASSAPGGIVSIPGADRGMGGPTSSPANPVAIRPATNLKPAERESYAMNYLIERGLAPHQAAGVVGNLIQESSLNTGARNPGDGADGSDSIGIAQWNGARAAGLKRYAAANGSDAFDINTQLDYVLHELDTTEAGAGRALRAAKTAEDAAAAFIGYERPQGWTSANPRAGHGWANRAGHAVRLAGGDWGPQGTQAASAPVQVASLDPSAGMGGAQAPSQNAQAPSAAPQAVNPQVAQMLIDGNVGGYQAPQPTVSDAMIAELLSNPWTEDLGQGLLQQRLQDNAANARLMREAQIERAQTLDERAYDASVRQEGYAREDSRNAVTDARQAGRDERADRQNDRDFAFKVEQGNKPPQSIQEYEYAVSQGFGGSYAEWEQANRRASANSVSVNTGEGDKFYENLDRKNAERFAALSDGGQNARGRQAQVDQLDALLQQSPSGSEAAIKLWLGDLGIATDGLDPLQASVALIEKLVPEQREPGSGPMSDADIAGFRRSLPRAINQPGGNQLIIGRLRAINEYDIARGEIADMVADRAITPAEGRKRLRELQNPLAGFTEEVRRLGEAPRVSAAPTAQTPMVDGVPVGAAVRMDPATAGQGGQQPTVRRYNPQTRRFE